MQTKHKITPSTRQYKKMTLKERNTYNKRYINEKRITKQTQT